MSTSPTLGQDSASSGSPDTAAHTISLEHLWRVLIRRRIVILVVILASFIAASIYIYIVPRLYTGTATMDISQQNSQTSLADVVAAPFESEQNTRMQTEERVMQSSAVLLEVADRLDLAHRPGFSSSNAPDSAHMDEHQRTDLIVQMRQGLAFSILPGTTIVSVSYTSTDPKLARDLPNALIDVYIGQDLGSGQIGTKRVSEWLHAQTEDLRHQVEDSARALADFQRTHNIIGTDESQNALVDKLRLMNEQLAAAQVDRITKETTYRVAQSGNPELMGNLGLDPQLQALRGQQTQLQAEYNALSTRYGPGYPRIAELSEQLKLLSTQIAAEVSHLQQHYRQDFQTSKQTEDQLANAVKDQEKVIFSLDERAADYAILRHNAEATRALYDQITVKLKESGIIDTLKSTRFRIVDPAVTPVIPVSPRKRLVLGTALFLGVLLGILLALLIDTIDDAVFSGEELERQTGLPVIGVLPHIAADLGRNKATPQLISLTSATDGAAEAFRGLRSAMQLGFGNLSPRLQIITSTAQGEGKSLIAANYARVLAQSGSKVLLVDADLRRGSVHKRFGISSDRGVTTILSDRTQQVDFLHPDPDIPTLSVLPRGPIPPNPTDLLASPRFMELLDAWQEQFDFVVVDSAPILPVADTLAIAQRADIVLMVVRVGVTSRAQFMRVVDRLRRLSVPVKGIVLNDVTKSLAEYNYYYGDYTYIEGPNGKKR